MTSFLLNTIKNQCSKFSKNLTFQYFYCLVDILFYYGGKRTLIYIGIYTQNLSENPCNTTFIQSLIWNFATRLLINMIISLIFNLHLKFSRRSDPEISSLHQMNGVCTFRETPRSSGGSIPGTFTRSTTPREIRCGSGSGNFGEKVSAI